MRKRINGKSYDTSTAKPVCERIEHMWGSESYHREILFKKRTGEYFVYSGDGVGYGMMDDDWKQLSSIRPVSFKEAARIFQGGERHWDIKEYERLLINA